MALAVTMTFTDDNGRSTNRTFTTTSSTISDAITDVADFATKADAILDCGLSGVSITTKDNAADFAPLADSNLDEGVTFQVTADDGFKYSIKMPIPSAAIRVGGGAISLVDAGVIAFTDLFKTGGKWRVNNRTPTFVTTVDKGLLDA